MLRDTSLKDTSPLIMYANAMYRWFCDVQSIRKLSRESVSKNIWSKDLGAVFGLIKVCNGDILDRRKCIRGKGTKFIVISFISMFKEPGNLIEHERDHDE